MPNPDSYTIRPRPHLTLAGLLAMLASLGSMAASCAGYGLGGLLLAILAVPLALVGMISSISPRVRGGIISFLALGLAVMAAIVAVTAMALGFYPLRRMQ